MVTAGMQSHGHITNSSHHCLSQIHMPITRSKAVGNLKESSSRSVIQNATVEEVYEPEVSRYEKHQHTIPIKSVEVNSIRRQSQGYEHYQRNMSKVNLNAIPSLDQIDDRDCGNSDHNTMHDSAEPQPQHTSPCASTHPLPPVSPEHYDQRIYSGRTHNPAVFLAILRIAEHNLPSVDQRSALNHLPNVRPTDPLPNITVSAPGNPAALPFIDLTPLPLRANDLGIQIAFLPTFYSDTRHCVGYFEVFLGPRGRKKIGNCLFTPCTEEDLRRYGLVEYLEGREGGGVEGMRRVGSRQGLWYERDTVEEYEMWDSIWQVVERAWGARLGYARGEREGRAGGVTRRV